MYGESIQVLNHNSTLTLMPAMQGLPVATPAFLCGLKGGGRELELGERAERAYWTSFRQNRAAA